MRKDIVTIIYLVVIIVAVIVIDSPNVSTWIQTNLNVRLGTKTQELINSYSDVKKQEDLVWEFIKNENASLELSAEIAPKIKQETPLVRATPTPIPRIQTPMKIMLIGDSMMLEGLGPELEVELRKIPGVTVFRHGKYSSGLNMKSYYDWFANSENYLKLEQPDVLIVIFGANDGQKIYDYKTNQTIFLNNPQWDEVYADRVKDYLKLTSPLTKRIYWIGHPIPSKEDFHVKFERMNKIYSQEIPEFRNVTFVPTWDRLAVNGKFSAFVADDNGLTQSVKYQDGVHLTPHGSRIISKLLIDRMKEDIDF